MTTTIHWEMIADYLRDELAGYGGLLHFFETQQRAIFDRDVNTVLQLVGEIDRHGVILTEARTRREESVAAFATENNRPSNSSLRSLFPCVEANARPLLEALINEINALILRVRRMSRHNHALLLRTVEVHQETLSRIRPQAFNRTYSARGRVSVGTACATGSLQIAG